MDIVTTTTVTCEPVFQTSADVVTATSTSTKFSTTTVTVTSTITRGKAIFSSTNTLEDPSLTNSVRVRSVSYTNSTQTLESPSSGRISTVTVSSCVTYSTILVSTVVGPYALTTVVSSTSIVFATVDPSKAGDASSAYAASSAAKIPSSETHVIDHSSNGGATSSFPNLPVLPAYATILDSALPSPVTVKPGQPIVIGGQTLTPGIPTVISGTTYSLAEGNTALVVGASTIKLPTAPAYATISDKALSSALTLQPGQPIVIAGQTLRPGAATAISGQTYSLAKGSNVLVVGSSTINLPTAPAYATISDYALPSPLTLKPGQPIVIAGTTLTPGATQTISGTAYSLATDGSSLVIKGSGGKSSTTIDLPASDTNDNAYTTITNRLLPSLLPLTSGHPIVIDGTTLTPGGAIETISRTPYSLAPGSTALVVGSSTIALTSPTSGGGGGLGSFILSGVDGGAGAGASPTSTTAVAYTTNASYTGPVYLGEAAKTTLLATTRGFRIWAVSVITAAFLAELLVIL